MIKFETVIIVRAGGSISGKIKEVNGGYQYQPKGSKFKGVVFPTLNDCKNSLIR